MDGPMDEAIDAQQGKKDKDKARQRLEEFTEQRYPGGLPPESKPMEKKPPRGTRSGRSKKSKPR